jgi:enoyl-[acyl-carrier protein] reductase I
MTNGNKGVLSGKRALIIGIANEHSIAWGCARALHAAGAELAITYLNDKARPFVEPLARELGAELLLPLDVSVAGQMEDVFAAIHSTWHRLDIALHSIAFAPREALAGGLLDCPADGFAKAMDVSCHSFIRMARMAVPLMTERRIAVRDELHGCRQGGAQLQRDGALQGGARGGCALPGFRARAEGIRVHAISPGPLRTRAASGLKEFDELLYEAVQKSPIGELVDIDDVGVATDLSGHRLRPPPDRLDLLRRRRPQHHGVTRCSPRGALMRPRRFQHSAG